MNRRPAVVRFERTLFGAGRGRAWKAWADGIGWWVDDRDTADLREGQEVQITGHPEDQFCRIA